MAVVASFDIHSLSFDRSEKRAVEELNELHRTKLGLKEIVDAGIQQVPNIFIYPKENQENVSATATINDGHQEIPVIDLQGLKGERRTEIVREIRRASETWGIFQLINHGVHQETILSWLESLKEFNEQPTELKGEFYTTDLTKKVSYHLCSHPVYGVAMWKDSLHCHFEDLSTEEIEVLPSICRKPISDYVRCVRELKDTLSELLSEALGLRSDYLKTIGCMEATRVTSHYYPACPEPALAMGTSKHSDPYFLTMLVQNDIDGLEVLYDDQWIDVKVKEGAIVVNIGDMLQIVSNDVFKSVEHRVQPRSIGPRLSSACFFHPAGKHKDQAYGPIKELLEGDSAPAFKETSESKYLESFFQAGITGTKALNIFRE